MKRVLILTIMLYSITMFGCDSGETENEKTAVAKTYPPEIQKIIDDAPVTIEYEIAVPPDSVPDELKAFAGHWVGKWNNNIPSQIIVTDIAEEKVEFVYSWGKDPEGNFINDEIKITADVIEPGKIKYSDVEVLTLELVKETGELKGTYDNGKNVTEIVLRKIE